MAYQLSPDVLTTEKDLTTIVPGVATSSAGYSGAFRWGPVEQVTVVDSENDLVTQFRGPDANTYKHFFTAGNFLQYGSVLQLVRVVGSLAVNAVPTGTPTIVGGESSSSSASETSSSTEASATSSESSLTISSSSTIAEATSSSSTAVSVTSTTSVSSSSEGDEAVLVKNRDHYDSLSGLDQVFIARYPGELGNSLFVSIADSESFAGWRATIGSDSYDLEAEFDGAPGTSSWATARAGSQDEMHIIVLDKDGEISGTKGTVLERYAYVSKALDAKKDDGTNNYYKEVINNTSQYIWWASTPPLGTNWGSNAASTTFVTLDTPLAYNFTGGLTDNANITPANIITGLGYLEDPETVEISLLLGGPCGETVAEEIISICESRSDCLGFISPEESDVVGVTNISTQTTNVTGYRDSLPSSSFCVMDSGWKYQYDRYNDVYRWVPLNGDTAGLCARTDYTNDPWYSPAGYNRGQIKGVIKLAYNPRKSHRDLLYRKGVNPVVSFPGRGTILYGDRTLLSRPSAFREIGIRRLFLTLRKAIKEAAQYTLFEFNDDFTRAQFRNMVEPYLRDVQGRNGMQEFKVVCDTTNNTAAVIDRQEFIGDIYIKPNHSINFIQLNFIAVRSNVTFEEVGA